jgi:hypothetical protein
MSPTILYICALFKKKVSVATRANGHCALLCPIRPQGAWRCGVGFATLRPRHGQSAQRSADRSTRPSGQAAPASCWAACSFCS